MGINWTCKRKCKRTCEWEREPEWKWADQWTLTVHFLELSEYYNITCPESLAELDTDFYDKRCCIGGFLWNDEGDVFDFDFGARPGKLWIVLVKTPLETLLLDCTLRL